MKKQINIFRTGNPFSLVIKVLSFIAILFVLDLAIGKVLEYLYYQQKGGQLYRTTYSLEKCDAQLIVFGSSRANHHYKPDIFEDSLKLSSYNAGREANFIFYHYAILKGILTRHTPDVIILDFVKGEFSDKREPYERISSLLPYYRSHPEIRDVVMLKSSYERIKLLSRVYPYNSLAFTILMSNLESGKDRNEDIKGYIPLHRVIEEKARVDSVRNNYEIDAVKVDYFRRFLEESVKAGVEVYVVSSPMYVKSLCPDTSLIIAQKIASEYNVPLLDFSGDTAFVNHGRYFWDMGHLNDKGADLFSSKLADEIKKRRQKE